MRLILREIVGDNDPDNRPRLLSFKEFCQYVYEPSQRIRSLNHLEDAENELQKTIGSRVQSKFVIDR
jgi:hypothetical protein